jgi:hypothetical protein
VNGFAKAQMAVLVIPLGFNYTDVFLLVTNFKGAGRFGIVNSSV